MGLDKKIFCQPDKDEVEITLIGTGGGYGESVLLKINQGEWVIIDSCINPVTKSPLPLEYLQNIGVDYKREVKFVICTHWHDDHILGLSEILKECQSAQFCMPTVNDSGKFLHYVGLDASKSKKGSISSFIEFQRCIEILQDRTNVPMKRMKSDLVLYQNNFRLSDGTLKRIELFSLSPSESVITKFDKELSQLFKQFSLPKKSIPEKSPNDKSAVIYFRYGEFSAMLGADLEVSDENNEGWHDIHRNSVVRQGKSGIYKIPHHGSSNGYNNSIYSDLIETDAILQLSPWNRNNKLPQLDMLQTYRSHSKNLFITSPVAVSEKPKKRDKNTTKLISLFSRKLTEVKFNEGIVRTRQSLISDKVSTETYGAAFSIAE